MSKNPTKIRRLTKTDTCCKSRPASPSPASEDPLPTTAATSVDSTTVSTSSSSPAVVVDSASVAKKKVKRKPSGPADAEDEEKHTPCMKCGSSADIRQCGVWGENCKTVMCETCMPFCTSCESFVCPQHYSQCTQETENVRHNCNSCAPLQEDVCHGGCGNTKCVTCMVECNVCKQHACSDCTSASVVSNVVFCNNCKDRQAQLDKVKKSASVTNMLQWVRSHIDTLVQCVKDGSVSPLNKCKGCDMAIPPKAISKNCNQCGRNSACDGCARSCRACTNEICVGCTSSCHICAASLCSTSGCAESCGICKRFVCPPRLGTSTCSAKIGGIVLCDDRDCSRKQALAEKARRAASEGLFMEEEDDDDDDDEEDDEEDDDEEDEEIDLTTAASAAAATTTTSTTSTSSVTAVAKTNKRPAVKVHRPVQAGVCSVCKEPGNVQACNNSCCPSATKGMTSAWYCADCAFRCDECLGYFCDRCASSCFNARGTEELHFCQICDIETEECDRCGRTACTLCVKTCSECSDTLCVEDGTDDDVPNHTSKEKCDGKYEHCAMYCEDCDKYVCGNEDDKANSKSGDNKCARAHMRKFHKSGDHEARLCRMKHGDILAAEQQ